jgi:hypothetical protein
MAGRSSPRAGRAYRIVGPCRRARCLGDDQVGERSLAIAVTAPPIMLVGIVADEVGYLVIAVCRPLAVLLMHYSRAGPNQVVHKGEGDQRLACGLGTS